MLPKDTIQQLDLPSRHSHHAIFNASTLVDIPPYLTLWNCTRILLVASKSLASQTSRVSDLQSALGPKLTHTHLGIGAHSPYADVRSLGLAIQRTAADCVITLGSSSYSDATKIACMLAANLTAEELSTDDAMEGLIDQAKGLADKRSDGSPLRERSCKLILVPTSLSASEWNGISSATNRDGKKQHFGGWDTNLPDLILLDPELAATSPEVLWLSSGVRCVDHCVELMCNPASGEEQNSGVNDYARRGLRCIIEGLTEYKKAKEGGVNTKEDEERLLRGISECQYGSRDAIAGLLIYKISMGPSHAIGHQLGSVAHVMHGVTSCIMLAPVLRWQLAHLPDPHFAQAQEDILSIFNDTLGWQASSAGDAVEKFVKSLGLPSTLREVGVTSDEQVEKIADRTLTDIWGKGKRQMELADLMDVLNSARG